ncbi:hypothetical protein Tco_0249483 [Tanacetum coccineum]
MLPMRPYESTARQAFTNHSREGTPREGAAGKAQANDNPGVEAKQRKRSGKDNKKGGNLKKGQAAGDTDGTTMA